MAPSTLQVYKYTGDTFIVDNLMYISHLSGVKDVKNTVHVRICESLISDAVASPEVSPSVCASSCSEAVRICCLNVQPWPIVVIVMLAASNLALKYG